MKRLLGRGFRPLPPKLGGLTEGGFLAAMCDGSVRFIPLAMTEVSLPVWATCDNGQIRVEPDKSMRRRQAPL